LRNKILEGKVKIDKAAIQKLAKNHVEKPIKSVQELQEITEKKPVGSVNKGIKLSDRVRESVKNADDFELTVTIRGSFIVKNNLQSVWRELRELSDEVVIDDSYTDTISIYQAPILGIIDRL
jgi:hypothetical protein